MPTERDVQTVEAARGGTARADPFRPSIPGISMDVQPGGSLVEPLRWGTYSQREFL